MSLLVGLRSTLVLFGMLLLDGLIIWSCKDKPDVLTQMGNTFVMLGIGTGIGLGGRALQVAADSLSNGKSNGKKGTK